MDLNNELTIREALPSDRYALEKLRLRLQSHIEASSRLVWHVTDEGRERFIGGIDKLLFTRNGRVLVAETGEDIVGYVYGQCLPQCRVYSQDRAREVNLWYVIGNMEGESFWSVLGFKPVIQIVNSSLEALHKRLNRSLNASRPQKIHSS